MLVASKTGQVPAAGQAAYSAAKAGVLSLVGTLAAELQGTGRTANAIVPDIIDTQENRRSMPNSDPDHWLSPAAIAEIIGWLASEASWPVNGAAIPVSAGGHRSVAPAATNQRGDDRRPGSPHSS